MSVWKSVSFLFFGLLMMGLCGCGDDEPANPCYSYCRNMKASGCADDLSGAFDKDKCMKNCDRLRGNRERTKCEGKLDELSSCVIETKFSCDWKYHELFSKAVPILTGISAELPECSKYWDAYLECKKNKK